MKDATAEDVLAGRARWAVEEGDCLALMRRLPDGCVQCCVTSPPYFGLRDYGTARWEGGHAGCDHAKSSAGQTARSKPSSGLEGGKENVHRSHTFKGACGKCGALRVDAQVGLEATPSEYAAKLVEVFREVRRVLRPDGTLWLSLGDSYAGGGGGNYTKGTRNNSGQNQTNVRNRDSWLGAAGVKAKDLIGVPWRVAFALQEDGWYLRACVPWLKANAMPESCRDRPSVAHEYVFLLAKRPTYFYDQDAARVAVSPSTVGRDQYTRVTSGKDGPYAVRHDHETPSNPGGRNRRTTDWWYDSLRLVLAGAQGMLCGPGGEPLALPVNPQPFRGAHFAVFPEPLAEPLVRTGTSEHGCCPGCGAPWRRLVEKAKRPRKGAVAASARDGGLTAEDGMERTGLSHFKYNEWLRENPPVTAGWEPSCRCGLDAREECVVLDPFSGSGTTGLVARGLQRRFVGFELSPKYAVMARARVAGAVPLLDAASGRVAAETPTLFPGGEG